MRNDAATRGGSSGGSPDGIGDRRTPSPQQLHYSFGSGGDGGSESSVPSLRENTTISEPEPEQQQAAMTATGVNVPLLGGSE